MSFTRTWDQAPGSTSRPASLGHDSGACGPSLRDEPKPVPDATWRESNPRRLRQYLWVQPTFICAACEAVPMSSLQARSNPEDANGDVGGLAHHPLVRQPPPRWTQCNPFHVSRPVPAVVRMNEVDAGAPSPLMLRSPPLKVTAAPAMTA